MSKRNTDGLVPDISLPPKRLAQFYALTMPEPNSGCWLWMGNIHPRKGYGTFQLRVGPDIWISRLAHRVSYEHFKGKIPEGLQIDHLCRVRSCVNPAHLEAVTGRENILRGTGWAATKAKQTHCLRGHTLTEDNIYRYGNERHCILCMNLRKPAKNAQQNAKRARDRHARF